MNINSAYLLIPVVLSSSFAFMFPISTLNNALVFNNKFFRMNDMVVNLFLFGSGEKLGLKFFAVNFKSINFSIRFTADFT